MRTFLVTLMIPRTEVATFTVAWNRSRPRVYIDSAFRQRLFLLGCTNTSKYENLASVGSCMTSRRTLLARAARAFCKSCSFTFCANFSACTANN
jgi:hypothetical protein